MGLIWDLKQVLFFLYFFFIYSFDLIQPHELISVRNKLYMEKVKGNLYLVDINWKTALLKKISKSIMHSSAWKMPWISHSSVSYIQPSPFLQLTLCRFSSLQLKRLEFTWHQGTLLSTQKTVTHLQGRPWRAHECAPQNCGWPGLSLVMPLPPTGSTKSLAWGMKYLTRLPLCKNDRECLSRTSVSKVAAGRSGSWQNPAGIFWGERGRIS